MIQPYNNSILFKPFKEKEQTASGLFIPETARKELAKGIIVAVGAGTLLRPMKLKANTIGYRVMDWGDPIDIHGERHYLMEDKAIIATE